MAYQSLADIQAEKARLHKEITAREAAIAGLWDSLVRPDAASLPKTPTQRLLQYASTAAGVFDGALFGWKLYRKFSGTSLFGGKKKRRR